MVNSGKLKDRMKSLGLKQVDLAGIMKTNQTQMSLMMRGEAPMFLEQAQMMAEILEIPQEEFGAYFMAGTAERKNEVRITFERRNCRERVTKFAYVDNETLDEALRVLGLGR